MERKFFAIVITSIALTIEVATVFFLLRSELNLVPAVAIMIAVGLSTILIQRYLLNKIKVYFYRREKRLW